jgi:nucleotide-binding universal stress UspA family protein
VRGRKELTKGGKDLAKEDATKFDKILVPLDGSLIAEAALPKAAELIRKNDDATLILLRATEATTLPCVEPAAPTGELMTVIATSSRSGSRLLPPGAQER